MPKSRKRKANGAEFLKWFRPLVDCLRELGSAKPRQAAEWIAKHENVPASVQDELMASGSERFLNQVQWARQYLVFEGLLDGTKRGIWKLTPRGVKTHLTDADAKTIFMKWVKIHAAARHRANTGEAKTGEEAPKGEISQSDNIPEDEVKESELLNVLRGLSAVGFEKFCRYLLLSHGFENVTVTKQTRDGGIDGEGRLKVNPFISSVVVFQCKRYRNSVSSEEVTRLRGSAGGRADKALLITTGTFSAPAREEAVRVSPHIELIDGEQLVEMCEAKNLGLKPRVVYDIDYDFFAQFQK
jgi:restriction system protein